MGASLCTCSRPRSRAPHPENNDTTFIGWCTGAPLQAPFCPPAARASPLSTSDCFQVRLWPPASARSAGRCCAIGRPSRMPDQALHSRGCFPPVFTDSSSWCCRWSQEQCSLLDKRSSYYTVLDTGSSCYTVTVASSHRLGPARSLQLQLACSSRQSSALQPDT